MFHFLCAFSLRSYCFCYWMHGTSLPLSPKGVCPHPLKGVWELSDIGRVFKFMNCCPYPLKGDFAVTPIEYKTLCF
jgi:hypothetical protein